MMNSITSPKVESHDKPSTSAFPSTTPASTSKPTGKVSPIVKSELTRSKDEGDEEDETKSSSSDHPDEFISGQWEIDQIQYCNFNPVTSRLNDSLSINTLDPKRMKNGAAYHVLNDKDTSDYKCFRDEHKELYKVGDFVYMEIDSAYPYVIGKVESFKMKKGTQMTVKVTRLYRREDLIADSQFLLDAERKEAGVVESNDEVRVRELFPSDAHLTQSVAVLKGKCHIVHLSIKSALQDGTLDKDVFFYCMSYSQDTGRLSACHPEIREGQRFQAVCPQLGESTIGDEPDRDQLVYKPGNMCATVEDDVVKYARSYRSLVLLENPQINELERTAFQGDRVKIDALDCLTRCGYVAKDAVKQMMVDDKVFLEHAQFLSADDTKKFVKGLRNYGKNFPKIVKEYLPSFSRDSLVHYYYWWKKSGEAFKPKKTNGTIAKKPLFPQTKRPQRGSNAEQPFVDYDSASEDDEFEHGRACHHCYSLDSRDWHHSGLLNQLLCTTCRHHFKRYGTMRDVERPKDIPRSLLHDEALNGGDEGDEGVRTRASNRRGDRLKTPNEDDRTPTKNGIDVEGERRSTPQRSVKIHKRTYHPSTSSTEESTPKKSKDIKPPHKLKPIHQLALTNKLNKMEKQESVDSDDQSTSTCQKNASTSADDSTTKKPDDSDAADSGEDPPIEIHTEHRLKNHPECSLTRQNGATDDSECACARTQVVFRCENEVQWKERRREQAEAKQKQRREEQARKQAEQEKQRIIESEQQHIRQLQQLQQAAMPMGMPRPSAQEMMHHQMRLPSMPQNSMMRPPAMSQIPPELMAFASARPELLQALAMQQHQQSQRPPQMMMQAFGGPGGLPHGLNPAALMHAQNPSNALMYQMQSQVAAAQKQHQEQAARMLEEQKRQQQQQLEQREREQRQNLQQQMQNQQFLMAMGINPQLLAAGFPMGINLAGLPTSTIPTSQHMQVPPPQQTLAHHQQQQQMNPTASQLDQLTAQLFRSAAAVNPAQLHQQQQQQELMQLLSMRLQHENQQRNQQQSQQK